MIAALVILGPLGAAILILAVRRRPGLLAVAGAAVGAVSALVTLIRADEDVGGATFAGLPGLPLRLSATPLAALLAMTVATVSLAVLIYAVGYMAGERDHPRFFAAMLLFVAAMQTLALAGDWILFLAAWELIGLASWLLIGFWFERPAAAAAATRAFVTTRAADVGLYLGVFALLSATRTSEVAATLDAGGWTATGAGLGFLLAAIGKSAQVPLQGWLLDAMAGPTPVSALLHSATLVVAGVVLLIRAHPLLPEGLLLTIGILGGVTAVVAGVTALAQGDLKRLLAASTTSQLGLMLLALGAGVTMPAIVHLVANAAMKSSLFLAAGIFQHQRDSTALAALRGVGRERRLAYAAFVLAGLALAGVPPLAGFWTKDAVIAAALDSSDRALLVPLAIVGSVLTAVYIARACRLLLERAPDARSAEGDTAGPERLFMLGGLAVLAALAATLGAAIGPIGHLLDEEAPERLDAVAIGVVAAAAGLILGWYAPEGRLLGPLLGTARRGFRINGGLDGLVAKPALALAHALDRLDGALHRGVLGVARAALGAAGAARVLDGALHGSIVEGTGRAGVGLAGVTRQTDERGIDRAIAGLVEETRTLGGRARRLQTGLVHRELLLAAGGAAGVVVIILLTYGAR